MDHKITFSCCMLLEDVFVEDFKILRVVMQVTKMKQIILALLVLFGVSRTDFVSDVSKKLKHAKSLEEFSTILQSVPFKEVFSDPIFQKEMLGGFNMNYIKALISSDIMKSVDLPKMMEAVKSGNGSSKVMFGALLVNLDALRSLRQMDLARAAMQGRLSDGMIYVPGLPLGLSIDCGLEFINLFGDIFTGNTSFLDPSVIGKIMDSPAGKMIDSWGKIPPGILIGNNKWHGAYDECMTISNARYCSVGMLALKKSVAGIYGACMPKNCSQQDVASIFSAIVSKQFGGVIEFTDKTSKVWCVEESFDYSVGFIITLVLTCILSVLVLLATIVELTQSHVIPSENQEKKAIIVYSPKSELNREDRVTIEVERDEAIEQNNKRPTYIQRPRVSGFYKVILCFSLVKNTRMIMSCECAKGAIRSINGMRVLSLFWIILGRITMFMAEKADNKVIVFQNFLSRWTSQVVINAYSPVDTFFVLSGLSVSYLVLRRLDKNSGRINIGLYLLHRFIKITPPYMFVILFYENITPYMASGPIGPMRRSTGDGDACSKYWWTNLFYINNFYPKYDEQCMYWSWFLANDMQFYIVAPAILYAFYRYDRRYMNTKYRYYGVFLLTFGGCLISVSIRMILISVENLPGAVVGLLKENSPYNGKDRLDYLFSKPWARINPYLIGLLLGYVLSRKMKITFHKMILYTFGWIIAFGLGYAVVYGLYESAFKDPSKFLSKTENLLYGSFSAFCWSLAAAWVIYACETGHGGLINSFLSWSVWIPLSRLTFGAYLLNPLVLYFDAYNHERSYHYQDNLFPFYYVGIVFFAYSLSYLLAIVVEYPALNLQKLMFKS